MDTRIDWPADLDARIAEPCGNEPAAPFAVGQLVLLKNQPLAKPVKVLGIGKRPWRDFLGRPIWRCSWQHTDRSPFASAMQSDEPFEGMLVAIPDGWIAPPEFTHDDEVGSRLAELAYLDRHDDVLVKAFGRDRLAQVRAWVLKMLTEARDYRERTAT